MRSGVADGFLLVLPSVTRRCVVCRQSIRNSRGFEGSSLWAWKSGNAPCSQSPEHDVLARTALVLRDVTSSIPGLKPIMPMSCYSCSILARARVFRGVR